ncbi:transposase [Thermococcus sp.]|uniref:RNA-guided endonuclease InsQ/TnpB family protein n=1 Tax=Thermococcus sp. TaxID=35749 RepID=UPI0026288F31|nr:transposase [Thermococcus sp.]MCD6142783.1 transposase [Thermococcus sp.]
MMEITKTIKCKLIGLTKRKLELLNREYNNFQHYLKTGEDRGVYSATKQQGKRTYRKIKPDKEYPLVIRKDLMDIRKTDNKLAKYWARIPICGVRGGIKAALAHQPFNFEEWEICGSKLVRTKDGEFYLHVTVKKDIELRKEYSSIIAIDLGAKWVGVSVALHRNKPKFYGKRIREVRGKYFWLRRKLGKEKKLKAIKKIGNKEKRIVNDELHKIAKDIVDEAEKHNAMIAIGNLSGVRKNNKGRKVNRKINSIPFYRLKEYIKYKALERGIAVIEVPEHYTSKQCSKCGSMNTKRPSQGLFICLDCEYQINADVNGAKNILKRAVGYMLTAGVVVTQPEGGSRFVLHTPQPPPNGFRWKPLAIARGGGHREVKFLL